jgi:hypothetical protein
MKRNAGKGVSRDLKSTQKRAADEIVAPERPDMGSEKELA